MAFYQTAATSASAPDYRVTDPPGTTADSISVVKWNPPMQMHYVATGNWDNKVRAYQVNNNMQNINAMYKAEIDCLAPVLDIAWYHDSSKIFTAACDNHVRCWDLASNQLNDMGQHDKPVKAVKWIPSQNCIVSGSWDGTIRLWQPTAPSNVLRVQCPERIFAMDVSDNYIIVAVAGQGGNPVSNLGIFDIRSPQHPVKPWTPSTLKYPVRCVSCFSNMQQLPGFACGSVEGRVALVHIHDKDKQSDFAFKCHRKENQIYSVNSIAFHPYGTFATAGSDGTFHFWDKENKQRLKIFNPVGNSISSGDFSADGKMYSYAIAYDWAKGYDQQERNNEGLMIHAVKEQDIKSRPKMGGKK